MPQQHVTTRLYTSSNNASLTQCTCRKYTCIHIDVSKSGHQCSMYVQSFTCFFFEILILLSWSSWMQLSVCAQWVYVLLTTFTITAAGFCLFPFYNWQRIFISTIWQLTIYARHRWHNLFNNPRVYAPYFVYEVEGKKGAPKLREWQQTISNIAFTERCKL